MQCHQCGMDLTGLTQCPKCEGATVAAKPTPPGSVTADMLSLMGVLIGLIGVVVSGLLFNEALSQSAGRYGSTEQADMLLMASAFGTLFVSLFWWLLARALATMLRNSVWQRWRAEQTESPPC